MLTDKQVRKIQKAFNGVDQRAVFKILGDTNRYRIFEMLGKQPHIAVSDIARVLKISVPLASQHLKILEHAKILQKEKIGKKVYYKPRADNKIARSLSKGVI